MHEVHRGHTNRSEIGGTFLISAVAHADPRMRSVEEEEEEEGEEEEEEEEGEEEEGGNGGGEAEDRLGIKSNHT